MASEARSAVSEVAHPAFLVVLHDDGEGALGNGTRGGSVGVTGHASAGCVTGGPKDESTDTASAGGIDRFSREPVVDPDLAMLLVGCHDVGRSEDRCNLRAAHADPDFLLHTTDCDAIGPVIADSRAVLRGGYGKGHTTHERRATHCKKCSKHVDALLWSRPAGACPGASRPGRRWYHSPTQSLSAPHKFMHPHANP